MNKRNRINMLDFEHDNGYDSDFSPRKRKSDNGLSHKKKKLDIDILDQLPDELIIKIFTFMKGMTELIFFSRVNKRIFKITKTPDFFRTICVESYGFKENLKYSTLFNIYHSSHKILDAKIKCLDHLPPCLLENQKFMSERISATPELFPLIPDPFKTKKLIIIYLKKSKKIIKECIPIKFRSSVRVIKTLVKRKMFHWDFLPDGTLTQKFIEKIYPKCKYLEQKTRLADFVLDHKDRYKVEFIEKVKEWKDETFKKEKQRRKRGRTKRELCEIWHKLYS
jgi:hypothetical protein